MGRAGAPYATDTLLSLLDGHDVVPREADMLASCGEVISAVVISHELRDAGVPAMALTGGEAGVVTDDVFGDATVLTVDPRRAALRSGGRRRARRGRLPGRHAGGRGHDPRAGRIATRARAPSAWRCSADAVEIYTDVDGVMTADPARVRRRARPRRAPVRGALPDGAARREGHARARGRDRDGGERARVGAQHLQRGSRDADHRRRASRGRAAQARRHRGEPRGRHRPHHRDHVGR